MDKNVNPLRVKYDSFHNTVKFPAKISSSILNEFSGAISVWSTRGQNDNLVLDFSLVEQPYTNGMLAIICTVNDLRLKGINFKLILPKVPGIRNLFKQRNWAHFLDPKQYPKSESTHDRHLVVRQFSDFTHIPGIVNDFMDVVLRNMSIPKKDIFSALEWSINEICDNVINHSDSKVGGFVEIIAYSKRDSISFAVADAGKGILKSLREGIPTLRTDIQAIGEAVKAGVTRNKEVGQGNGLAGSLRITTMTGGSLDIISGTGRFIGSSENSREIEGIKNQSYKGTVVSGSIKMNSQFSIVQPTGSTSSITATQKCNYLFYR